MSATRNDFEELLERSIDADLAAAERSGLREHVFSEGFEKRMGEFFAERRAPKSKKRPGRWLIIVVAAIIALAAAACAVPKIRQFASGFFARIFGDHVDLEYPETTRRNIENEYEPTFIPDGFTLAHERHSGCSVVKTYCSDSLNFISFLQATGNCNTISVNRCGSGELTEKVVGDKTVLFVNSTDTSYATWVNDGYLFSISASMPLEPDVFEAIIASIQGG